MSPDALEEVLLRDRDSKIKTVIPVHFAGQPADLPRIHKLATAHGAVVIDDACHALGASYDHEGRSYMAGCGEHSLMSVFSFHPVKHVATGEGGAVSTRDDELARKLRLFRNHGMTKEHLEQDAMALSSEGDTNPWYYEMQVLGPNYRLTDMQSALGISQLGRLQWSVERRNKLATHYRALIGEHFPTAVRPLEVRPGVMHAYHLFVVRIDFEHFGLSRAAVMNQLRKAKIGTQVHYIPVPLQPYYRRVVGTGPGDFPNAEAYYAQALSLPMYPNLTENDCQRVIERLADILSRARQN
ncbi:MAG: UDP-4-amino-4,6-dideoxy-N-acetyl-beta-L-altrosamine transaminase [Candidatus Zixiibacteriota bacterium]|nr:MAG: UDP-4-amino-4,6-dideoxy-N-acetyl-beta-L-altrosamine transaminase [candidate division Zixibacteria bacterium]